MTKFRHWRQCRVECLRVNTGMLDIHRDRQNHHYLIAESHSHQFLMYFNPDFHQNILVMLGYLSIAIAWQNIYPLFSTCSLSLLALQTPKVWSMPEQQSGTHAVFICSPKSAREKWVRLKCIRRARCQRSTILRGTRRVSATVTRQEEVGAEISVWHEH